MSFLTAGSLKDQSGADFDMISWVMSNDSFAFGVEKRQEFWLFSKPDEFSAEGLTTGGSFCSA